MLAHRFDFRNRVAIAIRSFPLARENPARVVGKVPVMQRRPPDRVMPTVRRQHCHLDRNSRRTARRSADDPNITVRDACTQFRRILSAHLSLTRAHADCRIPFKGLDVVETLGYRPVKILRGYVLAKADETLAVELRIADCGLGNRGSFCDFLAGYLGILVAQNFRGFRATLAAIVELRFEGKYAC